MLAGLAYAVGMATGFASDDYGWLRHGVRGELGWDTSIKLAGHTNALPLEIALYHLKFTLFGFNALAYHLFSLVGHAGNVLFIYALARRLGSGVRVASLAAAFAAVLAAGSQAVYWMSGDPHLYAGLLALGALILYIDHRERGGWWRYAGALVLAIAAPLVKAEGVAVIAGVVGYEVIWRRPPSFTWKAVPFALAPLPFVVWEWTTTDQLARQRGFGFSTVLSGLDYLRQLVLPLAPSSFIESAGSLSHRVLNVGIGGALYAEAAVLAVLFIAGLTRRQGWLFFFLGMAGTAPALVVTLGTQPRYDYFAGLVAMPVVATGAWVLFKRAWDRYEHQMILPATTLVLAVVISFQAWITAIESGALRAAHAESLALRTAVLKDHPAVPDGTPICILNSPLDSGTAISVFSDPRLAPEVGLPAVSRCDSADQAVSGGWVYARQPDGTYLEVR